MARTTVEAVRLAIDTSLEDDVVSGYIDDASLWVTTRLVGKVSNLTLLELIEKYLACHFVTMADPRLKDATFGDTRETYQRDGAVTEYLKAAMAMDPTGTLEAAFGGRGKTFVRVGQGYA